MTDSLDMGERVTEALKASGLDTPQLIKMGVAKTRQAVYGWKKTGRIKKEKLALLAEATGIPLSWWMTPASMPRMSAKDAIRAARNEVRSPPALYLVSPPTSAEVEQAERVLARLPLSELFEVMKKVVEGKAMLQQDLGKLPEVTPTPDSEPIELEGSDDGRFFEPTGPTIGRGGKRA